MTTEMFVGQPPGWSLRRHKPLSQHVWDFLGAPLRMVLLPDHRNEQLHLTSLRAERLARVLPELRGRVLDIGAGDNMLVKLHKERHPLDPAAQASVGLDVTDWGGGCTIVENCKTLPFDTASFDTVSYIACINHIPEREEALAETLRVLKPGGRVIVTMIGRLVGTIGHALWWYSEDKHRDVHHDELMGMDSGDIHTLLEKAGFADIQESGFVYGLNRLYIASRP
jgi:SAM-dependent methyltransferase